MFFLHICFPGKLICFWKTKVHQRFWYPTRNLFQSSTKLAHYCKNYQLSDFFWDRLFASAYFGSVEAG